MSSAAVVVVREQRELVQVGRDPLTSLAPPVIFAVIAFEHIMSLLARVPNISPIFLYLHNCNDIQACMQLQSTNRNNIYIMARGGARRNWGMCRT